MKMEVMLQRVENIILVLHEIYTLTKRSKVAILDRKICKKLIQYRAVENSPNSNLHKS